MAKNRVQYRIDIFKANYLPFDDEYRFMWEARDPAGRVVLQGLSTSERQAQADAAKTLQAFKPSHTLISTVYVSG